MKSNAIQMLAAILLFSIFGCNQFAKGSESKWVTIAEDSTGKSLLILDSVRGEHRFGWVDVPLSPPQIVNDYGDSAYYLQTQFVVNCDEKIITPKIYLYKNKNDTTVFSQGVFPLRAIDISKGSFEEKIMINSCKQK